MRFLKSSEKTKISPMAEAKTRKNTFFAWISIKQMNELPNQAMKRTAGRGGAARYLLFVIC
jgi:hypothetical protein